MMEALASSGGFKTYNMPVLFTPIYNSKLLNIKFELGFSLQLLFQTILILKRTERVMIKKMYIGLHVKYPLLFSGFDES